MGWTVDIPYSASHTYFAASFKESGLMLISGIQSSTVDQPVWYHLD